MDKSIKELEDSLSLETQARLLKAISALAEKQYRKGVQHGAAFISSGEVTAEDICKWRHDGSNKDYSKAIDLRTSINWLQPDRWVMELQGEDMNFLHNLIGIIKYRQENG